MLSSTFDSVLWSMRPALEVVMRSRTDEHTVEAAHTMERALGQAVSEELCTTEAASRNRLDLLEVRTLVVGTERTLWSVVE